MSVPRRLTVRVPAKVNLHLEVRGRRADRYHELRTLFASVGVWDEIEVEAASEGVIELDVRPAGRVPAGPENLVVRAATALRAATGAIQGARITLRKGIPVAGGLGGGSADAAATLVALARLWGTGTAFAELHPIAAALGADVPFFLLGGVAWGVGRGSEVYPLPDLPAWWLVLLPGEEGVPTAEVYRLLAAPAVDERPHSAVYEWIVAGGVLPLSACRNELEPTVVAHWHGVSRRLDEIRRTRPRLALLSGSGGTVFGVYEGHLEALEAARLLAERGPILAPLLTREASTLRPSAGEDHGDH